MCLHSFEYHSLIISSFTNDKRFGFVAFHRCYFSNLFILMKVCDKCVDLSTQNYIRLMNINYQSITNRDIFYFNETSLSNSVSPHQTRTK